MQTPVAAFVDDMAKFGLCPRAEAELVVYDVTPAAGVYAGDRVETGVAAAELEDWPHAPPHWVHLPDVVVFNSTNSEASPGLAGCGTAATAPAGETPRLRCAGTPICRPC